MSASCEIEHIAIPPRKKKNITATASTVDDLAMKGSSSCLNVPSFASNDFDNNRRSRELASNHSDNHRSKELSQLLFKEGANVEC